MELDYSVDDVNVRQVIASEGVYEMVAAVRVEAGARMIMSFASSTTTSGVAAGVNGDAREVTVLLVGLVFE